MATDNFSFEVKAIGKLLKNERLAVPPNQRAYMWEDGHVKNLLQDFDEAMTNDDTEYFLGTVVIVKAQKGLLTIQDGQQRLATISILLARLRDLLKAAGRAQSAQSVDGDFLRSIDRDTETQVPHLTLNQQDHDFFLRAILCGVDEQGPDPARQSNYRLQGASRQIAEFLADKLKPMRPETQPDLLLRWVRFIEDSAQVVVVIASDEVNAYRVFETLNDRGLKASQADILKNYFFSKSGDRLSEAQNYWSTMDNNLESLGDDENENLVTYVRHLWITTHGPTKERELAAKIKAEITSATKTIGFLSESASLVTDYLALDNSKHSKWAKYDSSVRKNIETISEHLKVAQIRPLLFAVAVHFTPEEASKAFKLFVSWSVRFLIFGGRGGMLDTQYSLRAGEVGRKEITKARQLRDAMSDYVPTDAQFQEAFASARVSRPHLARYYLRAIEKTRTADPQPEYVANEDVQDVSLEHVLPVTMSDQWPIDPEAFELAQRMIGNMVLLKANQNRDLGNSGFPEKAAVYAQSGYYTTKDVADNLAWGLEQIKVRQARLAECAVQTWTLKFED